MKEALREVLGNRQVPANPYHALAEHFRTIEIRCAHAEHLWPMAADPRRCGPLTRVGAPGQSGDGAKSLA